MPVQLLQIRTMQTMSSMAASEEIIAIRLFFCLRFLGDCLFRGICCLGRGGMRFCAVGLGVTVFCLAWRVDFCSNILKYSSYSLSFSFMKILPFRIALSKKAKLFLLLWRKGCSGSAAFLNYQKCQRFLCSFDILEPPFSTPYGL